MAQPENDRCENAISISLGVDPLSCIPLRGDTRGTEDATQVPGPEVCSASWYMDDVWYKVEIGDVIPEHGITIEVRLDPNIETDLPEIGMAIYENCLEETVPLHCFFNETGRRIVELNPSCLQANQEYLIRVWSSPSAIENSGTFSVCAYSSIETAIIFYEEDFNNGLNGWTNVPITESWDINKGIMVPDDWVWTETNCVPNPFGGNFCLADFGSCHDSIKGAVGFPASWYQFGRSVAGPLTDIFPPYPVLEAYLVSPSINLTDAHCVNLKWTESFAGLNGSDISALGSLLEFSIDEGQNWRSPSLAINSPDVSTFYDGNYVVYEGANNRDRVIPLLGAEGQANVKLRFGFKGNFYRWIIDNIKIVECVESEIHIPISSISNSHINPMSIHQIDTVNFMLDLFNLTIDDYEDVNVNIVGIDNSGVITHTDSARIENFNSDTNARFTQLPKSFVPESSVEEYTFSYSLNNSSNQGINNDGQSFSFSTVDENIFRKEDGIVSTILAPNFSIDGIGQDNNRSWEMGNIFFATNDISPGGYPYIFDHISFQLANYDELIDETIKVWLYKIEDKNFDFIINKDDGNEITTLGSAEYVVIGSEDGFVTTLLSPFPESENISRLTLEKNTHYMAVVENVNNTGQEMYISASESDQYEASYRNKRILANGDLSKIRYAHAFSVNPQNHFRIGPSDNPIESNLDENLVPFIRLGYKPFLGVGVSHLQLKEFQITPSPATEFIDVSFELENANEIKLSIIDVEGKTLKTMQTNWNGNKSTGFFICYK